MLGRVQQVQYPDTDGLDHDFGTVPFEKAVRAEISVAHGRLRPEFADEFHGGTYPQGIDAHGTEATPCIEEDAQKPQIHRPGDDASDKCKRSTQPGRKPPSHPRIQRRTHTQRFLREANRCFPGVVGRSGTAFVRARAIGEIVQDIPHHKGAEEVRIEMQVEGKALIAGIRAHGQRVRKREHTEGRVARIGEHVPVFLLVDAEAAGSVGSGRDVDIPPADVIPRQSPGLFRAQKVDETPAGEIQGIAETVVRVPPSDLVIGQCRRRKDGDTESAALQQGPEQAFMRRGQSSEYRRHRFPFLSREGRTRSEAIVHSESRVPSGSPLKARDISSRLRRVGSLEPGVMLLCRSRMHDASFLAVFVMDQNTQVCRTLKKSIPPIPAKAAPADLWMRSTCRSCRRPVYFATRRIPSCMYTVFPMPKPRA